MARARTVKAEPSAGMSADIPSVLLGSALWNELTSFSRIQECRLIQAVARQVYLERTGKGFASWRNAVPRDVPVRIRKAGIQLVEDLIARDG